MWDILKAKCALKKGWGGGEWAALGQYGPAETKKEREEKLAGIKCVM